MPVKKKRTGRSHVRRKGSSRVLYLSLGAAVAAFTTAFVTLLLRRNLTARLSDSGMDLPREGEIELPAAPSPAAEVAHTDSASPPPDEEKRSFMVSVRGFGSRMHLPWRRESGTEPAEGESPVVPAE